MGVNISYMGTKRELAPAVAEVIKQAQQGILLDAFAGMCVVGEEVAPQRQVWSNDAQVFAAETARSLLTSRDEPPAAIKMADLHYDLFEAHAATQSQYLARSLTAEEEVLGAGTFSRFESRSQLLSQHVRSETGRLESKDSNLFASTYSNTYFGVRQCIAIDAIVKGVNSCRALELISDDQRRWLLIALGRCLIKLANSTGHFAQFLKPKRHSFRRYQALRRRDVWAEWLFSIGELNSVGTIDWRRRNKVFNADTLALLTMLQKCNLKPSVIYADPPYTDDQYSRYYHLLDTLILYDYPRVSGAGLYRSSRFRTPFSLKSRVIDAFKQLADGSAQIGADLVLSYPTNGLLYELETKPDTILKSYYSKVDRFSVTHSHSTFGASKGPATSPVTEQIYWARL